MIESERRTFLAHQQPCENTNRHLTFATVLIGFMGSVGNQQKKWTQALLKRASRKLQIIRFMLSLRIGQRKKPLSTAEADYSSMEFIEQRA